MAASPCVLEEILTCMLDFEPLKDPKVLQCGHTFCLGCLEKVYLLGQGHGTGEMVRHLFCPICSQPTLVPNGKISELPDNITVTQLRNMGQTIIEEMHSYQEKDKTVDCDSCLQSTRTGTAVASRAHPVRYFCYKCSEHYCQECCTKHKTLFKDHAEVVDLESNLKDMLQVFCSKHSKYMKFYCQHCSQALCTACRLHDHPKEHCIVDISDRDTIVQKRGELRKLQPLVTSNLAEADARSRIVQKVRKQVFDAYADMDTQLLSHFERLKQSLMDHLNRWYSRLETERIQKRQVFEKQLDITQEDLNFHISSCQSLTGFVNHILQEDTKFQPLSLYSDLIARMQTLDRFLPDLDSIDFVPVAKFVPGDNCFAGLTEPGEWKDYQLDVSYNKGEVAFTPTPKKSESTQVFFGEDCQLDISDNDGGQAAFLSTPRKNKSMAVFYDKDHQPDVSYNKNQEAFTTTSEKSKFVQVLSEKEDASLLMPPGKVTGWTSPGICSGTTNEAPNAHDFDPSRLRTLDLQLFHRSISENHLVTKKISDEEEFQQEPRSDTKKQSRYRLKGRLRLKPKDRTWSEVDLQEGQIKKDRDDSNSGSSRKSTSFFKSILRKSFGIGKKKEMDSKAASVVEPPPQPMASPIKPAVDCYTLLWRKAGEVVRPANTCSKTRYTVRYLTGASHSVDGMWYVADHMAAKVTSYNAHTSTLKTIFSLGAGSFKPWEVAVADLGEGHPTYLYCTDTESRCIQVFAVEDREEIVKTEFAWGHGDIFNPCGICYNSVYGKVVVSDPSPTGPTLLITDLAGTVVSRVTSIYGGGDSQMKYPWYITSDNHGRIYVSDRDNSSVKVFSMDGHFISRFKHRIGHPAGITVDPMGYILVADRSGNHNIATFTPDGQFVGNLKTEDELSWPQAVCCDSYGSVMVTEYLENSLTALKCFGK